MLDLTTAARALGARHTGDNVEFTRVTTDSRQVQPGDLFVALRGERFDGHSFTDTAVKAGAAAVLVERTEGIAHAGPLLVVDNTHRALGQLARYWRERFSMPLIAVTGSNGKTTVKDMLAEVLRKSAGADAVLATQGNLNNDIGMPLMLLRLRTAHRFAVIEMGMNHLGEIRYLTELAQPTIALVNNAGVAHIGELGSRDAIARAKGEIYEGLGTTGIALINADDAFAGFWRDLNRGRPIVEFALERSVEVTAQHALTANGSLLAMRTPAGEYSIRLQVPGLHNVRNALAASAAAYALGISPTDVAAGLGGYTGTKGRLQRKTMRAGGALIDDSYNANPDSVKAAIAVLAGSPGKRVLVLGDMGELGNDASALHTEVGEAARRAGIERLFTLGELSAAATRSFGPGATHFTDVEVLCAALESQIDADTTMLVKGSRFMRMERVVQRFVDGEPLTAKGEH